MAQHIKTVHEIFVLSEFKIYYLYSLIINGFLFLFPLQMVTTSWTITPFMSKGYLPN